MTGAANNINDLLGIGAGSSSNGVGSGPTLDPGDSTFSALLSMLSGLGLNTASASKPTANVADPNSVLPTLPGLFTLPNLNPINIQTKPAASPKSKEPDVATSQPEVVSPISLVGLNSRTLALLVSAQLPQPSLTGQIPEGKFTTSSATITGGKLDLHLVSKDNPNADLHVTLPADLVQVSNVPTVVANPTPLLVPKNLSGKSASLDANGAPQQTLTDLIAQLNVTEVAIETAPTIQTTAQQTAAATVKFINVENPAAPVMVAVVPAPQLKAFANQLTKEADATEPNLPTIDNDTQTQVSDIKPAASSNTNGQTIAAKPVTPVQPMMEPEAQPLFRTAAVRINTRVLTQDSPFVQKLLNDSDAAEISPFKLDLSGNSLKALNMVRPTAANTPALTETAVRITLPQNFSGLLDNPGRSINIKLEPDYLGPARLTLSMRGETLSAKLTVDTPQAKAAVENSITQLTDQLARVGIKVDHFDVTMHGGGADSQAFHRPQDWFTPQRTRITQRDEEPSIEHTMKIETTTLPPATYLHRRSVNLYA